MFHSILSDSDEARETPQVPACFADLNLDPVIDSITLGKNEYNLKPFFYAPLHDLDAVCYRHEVMQALENPILYGYIQNFAQQMRTVREYLTRIDKLHYRYQKERWFLAAVSLYCDAVRALVGDFGLADVSARGLLAFRDYLTAYAQSDAFTTLLAETQQLEAALATIHYAFLISGGCVTVRQYEAAADYSTEVLATFEKFKQGAVKDYRVEFRAAADMNHVEAQILEQVARLYPDIFASLDAFCAKNSHFVDDTLGTFDREIQFYVAYLDFITRLKRAGLAFCYPQMSATDKQVADTDGFDIALADKLLGSGTPVVCNDFSLSDPERIIVVTGPNQGGKTTFARTFGQLHYLASLGCPVPGREACLFLCDQIFTHFEKEEDVTNLRGKLQDDLVRIDAILNRTTSDSIIILNEIFTSTTLEDAVFLSKQVLKRIMERDLLCVCVTFIDELASLNEKTVSMTSTIVPDNPARRTFKIVRRPADGLAYALSIAEKYRLTYDSLKERIPS